MKGVMTCSRLDMWGMFGDLFASLCPDLRLYHPDDITDPAEVTFLVTFVPDPEVFVTYPNLQSVYCVGAGIDGILACPTLPKDIPVHRIEDPDQARQMAAFAVFHVMWHHRNMPKYLAQQRDRVWERELSGLSPASRRVGVLGFGNMGRAVAKALAARITRLRSSVGTPVENMPSTLRLSVSAGCAVSWSPTPAKTTSESSR